MIIANIVLPAIILAEQAQTGIFLINTLDLIRNSEKTHNFLMANLANEENRRSSQSVIR